MKSKFRLISLLILSTLLHGITCIRPTKQAQFLAEDQSFLDISLKKIDNSNEHNKQSFLLFQSRAKALKSGSFMETATLDLDSKGAVTLPLNNHFNTIVMILLSTYL